MSLVPATARTYESGAPARGLSANARGKNLGEMVIVCCRLAMFFSSRHQTFTVASAEPETKILEDRLETAIQLMELL